MEIRFEPIRGSHALFNFLPLFQKETGPAPRSALSAAVATISWTFLTFSTVCAISYLSGEEASPLILALAVGLSILTAIGCFTYFCKFEHSCHVTAHQTHRQNELEIRMVLTSENIGLLTKND